MSRKTTDCLVSDLAGKESPDSRMQAALTALLLLLLLCGQVNWLVVRTAQLRLLCQAMQQVLQAAWPHRGVPLLHRMHCAF